jgi:hypothetical protein
MLPQVESENIFGFDDRFILKILIGEWSFV